MSGSSSNNNILVQHFEALKQQAAEEGSKGKIITYSRICKTLKELPPITSINDVQGIKGIGKKTLDVIAELLAATTLSSFSFSSATSSSATGGVRAVVTGKGKRKQREEEEEEEKEDGGEEDEQKKGGHLPTLLLADSFDAEKHDATGWFMSEKLDGVRCYWDGQGRFWSRNQNRFYAPKWFTDALPQGVALDGELFCGRGQFQTTVSIVRSYTPDDARWRTVKYLVFDTPDEGAKPFEHRMKLCKNALGEQNAVAKWVEHIKCRNNDHVEERLAQIVAAGGEGLMLRKPGSHYEGKRSKTLLKVKRAYDAEARVIGHIEGKGRNAGCVGSLRVQMANGKEFSLGSGMNDKDRDNPPKIGAIVTYQFTELTAGKVPRFPRFVRVRTDVTEPHDFE